MHVSIRLKGHLDPSWRQWLEGLQIVHEGNGTSLLIGVLKAQAALHGVLLQITRLGLTLLSLESKEVSSHEKTWAVSSHLLVVTQRIESRKTLTGQFSESCGEEMILNILMLVCQHDLTLSLIACRKEE